MGSITNTTRPQIILGAAAFGTPRFPDIPSIKAFCDLFHSYGHTHIDSARGYPNENPGFADKALNLSGATAWATIDTKVLSVGVKAHSREKADESMRLSLEALGFEEGKKQVDVMFLHAPCPDVPFEEVMEVMNDAYKRGLFRRFGLSNYSPQQVEDLVAIAKAKGNINSNLNVLRL
jgi:aflatoxin B1 aldehyde reductase